MCIVPVMPRNKSYAKEAVHAQTGRDVDELLRELYIAKRHSAQEIADAIGVSRMTVVSWLKDAGISRDDRPAVAL
jgi:DNA invertase Pin-like site-specific DNA recombinase